MRLCPSQSIVVCYLQKECIFLVLEWLMKEPWLLIRILIFKHIFMSSPHNLVLRFDNHILCRLNPSQDLLIFTMYFHWPLPFSYLVMLAGFHRPKEHLEKWRMKGNLSQMKKGKVNFLVKGRLLKIPLATPQGRELPGWPGWWSCAERRRATWGFLIGFNLECLGWCLMSCCNGALHTRNPWW